MSNLVINLLDTRKKGEKKREMKVLRMSIKRVNKNYLEKVRNSKKKRWQVSKKCKNKKRKKEKKKGR